MSQRLIELLLTEEPPKVLVIGDLILDRYLRGEVKRISPEAPIPVMKLEEGEPEDRLGGMANVAHNLLRLGASVFCAGVVGDDPSGRFLCQKLIDAGADVLGVIQANDRPTTRKTRMISLGQQILRLDREVSRDLTDASRTELIAAVVEAVGKVDLVAISDYAKGVVSDELIAATIKEAKEKNVPVVVDPKSLSFERYRGASVLTPNRKEAEEATGITLDDRLSNIHELSSSILSSADLGAVVITLGERGMFLARRSGESLLVPQQARSVYDVTGAGDTVLALLCRALAGGADLADAVQLANLGAGIVVGRLGASAVSPEELLSAMSDSPYAVSPKILPLKDLVVALQERRDRGHRIVFTNGCFDILHPGHVKYLKFARSRGDLLVVGLNSDSSVRSLKGPTRPVQKEDERAEVLASLACVDHVVVFSDSTPLELVEAVRPDVLVKGEDWRDKGVVGREFVEAYGGEVSLAPMLPGVSSSEILRRVSDKKDKEEA